LKHENILLTSNLSLYICDFATFKPANVSIEDITDYTYYFGTNNTDIMKGCYLAPERLVEKNKINENNEKTYQMDVFSAGVIIAELFLERTIFDYTGLLNYKKGNKNLFNIDEILSNIPQNNIRSLIYKMIEINPEKRIDITEALNILINEICPIPIPRFFLHFNAVITSTKFWKPDLIIGHIFRFWETIWKIIFGANEEPIPLSQNLNFSITNKIILESPFSIFGENSIFNKDMDNVVYLGEQELIMNPDNGEILEKHLKKCDNVENKSCIYLIIDYILHAIQYTKYDTTNLLALEMLYILSKKIPDIAKLQLILPYFISNLKRKKYIIQLTSINYLFDILYSIDFEELILPVTEYNYFGSYVYPAL
jgi:serine/threonine protein kinase